MGEDVLSNAFHCRSEIDFWFVAFFTKISIYMERFFC